MVLSYAERYDMGLQRTIPLIIVSMTSILFVSTHDAWHMHVFVRIFVLLFTLVILVPWLVKMYFDEHDVDAIFLTQIISFKNIQLSTGINLSIFLIKQCISLILFPTKSSVITHKPKLVWYNSRISQRSIFNVIKPFKRKQSQ